MTFLVDQDGIVYEKDIGVRTAAAAKTLTRYTLSEIQSSLAEKRTFLRSARAPDPLFGFRNAERSVAHLLFLSCKILESVRGRGVDPKECPECGGVGYVAKPVDFTGKSEGVAFIRIKCAACGGTGRRQPISPTTAG